MRGHLFFADALAFQQHYNRTRSYQLPEDGICGEHTKRYMKQVGARLLVNMPALLGTTRLTGYASWIDGDDYNDRDVPIRDRRPCVAFELDNEIYAFSTSLDVGHVYEPGGAIDVDRTTSEFLAWRDLDDIPDDALALAPFERFSPLVVELRMSRDPHRVLYAIDESTGGCAFFVGKEMSRREFLDGRRRWDFVASWCPPDITNETWFVGDDEEIE